MLEYRITAVQTLTDKQKQSIWQMLVAADKEFVPPLSERNSTLQTKWTTEEEESKLPTTYFNLLLEQKFLLALEGEEVIGFMSYIPEHKIELKEGGNVVADYISTVITRPEHRSKGVTKAFYHYILGKQPDGFVATRTWSTNHAHLQILKKIGFENILTLKDDRGEGIDTVYYCKKR